MRILIVEDEVKIANGLQHALELQKYAVDVAYDGEAGLDLAIGEEFDLIILDVMLPKIDGIEVCKRIRDEKIVTPIIMLTAKGQVHDKVLGLDSGADDYLVKPFSLEELFARVRALIRRPEKKKETVLKISDLSLDPANFKVKREGKTINVSAREYAILEYLMRNKNTILSKEKIVSHIWNYDSDVLPATVEVHMKHLRDKIDAPFKKQLIKTARGFGYEITDEE
jgi:DNA-binding response OmpR family regulator